MDISQRVLTRVGDHKRAFSSWLLLLQAACEGAGGMLAAVQTLAQHEVRWPETERGGVAGRQRERRSHTGATHNMHKTRHISRSTRTFSEPSSPLTLSCAGAPRPHHRPRRIPRRHRARSAATSRQSLGNTSALGCIGIAKGKFWIGGFAPLGSGGALSPASLPHLGHISAGLVSRRDPSE